MTTSIPTTFLNPIFRMVPDLNPWGVRKCVRHFLVKIFGKHLACPRYPAQFLRRRPTTASPSQKQKRKRHKITAEPSATSVSPSVCRPGKCGSTTGTENSASSNASSWLRMQVSFATKSPPTVRHNRLCLPVCLPQAHRDKCREAFPRLLSSRLTQLEIKSSNIFAVSRSREMLQRSSQRPSHPKSIVSRLCRP